MNTELIRQIVRDVLAESTGSQAAVAEPLMSLPDQSGLRAAPRPKNDSHRPVITAEMIRQKVDGEKANTIELPRSSILTPLARDVLAQRRIRIEWVDVSTATVSPTTRTEQVGQLRQITTQPSGPVLIAYDEKTVEVQQLLATLGRESSPVPIMEDTRTDVDLPQRIRGVASQIGSQNLSGAIVLVQTGEFALAYVNKFKGVRAALGSDWQSVQRAIGTIGANVLIIDYANKTFYQLLQLLRHFVAAKANGSGPGKWQRYLDEV